MDKTMPGSVKNLLELSPERDFPGPFPVRTRYAILSSPRSGSTLLSRMLFATGMAGDPIEYLNRHLLALAREQTGKADLTSGDFLKEMERRRTSPNGLFGMQMHYSQFYEEFDSARLSEPMREFIVGFDKLIWVRRRDRMRQAVSMAIARQTRSWSSEEAPDIGALARTHPINCVYALKAVCANDLGWEHLIKTLGLRVLVVWYEDLVGNYREESAEVLRYLGLDAETIRIPDPPIRRQASELNEQLFEQWLEYLGLAENRLTGHAPFVADTNK